MKLPICFYLFNTVAKQEFKRNMQGVQSVQKHTVLPRLDQHENWIMEECSTHQPSSHSQFQLRTFLTSPSCLQLPANEEINYCQNRKRTEDIGFISNLILTEICEMGPMAQYIWIREQKKKKKENACIFSTFQRWTQTINNKH